MLQPANEDSKTRASLAGRHVFCVANPQPSRHSFDFAQDWHAACSPLLSAILAASPVSGHVLKDLLPTVPNMIELSLYQLNQL
jgi:hypothetical protein